MENNSLSQIKSNNTIEQNNKLALECSYLINEIKRKNSSLLLPIFITNKKIYLKGKLLSAKKCHFDYKNKTRIKRLISQNVKKKYYNKNLSADNILSKQININKRNNNISSTSLYKLPKLKFKNRINKSKSVILHNNNNNNFNNLLNEKENDEKVEKTKKKSNFLGIENFMKEKFYSDTENKLRNNIHTKYFRNDWMIKDKIIFLKKFGIFWRGFIQYCTPIIKLKKYQLDFLNKKQKFNDNDTDFNYDNNYKNNKTKTNNKIIHNNRHLYNTIEENSKAVETVKSLSLPKIESFKRKVN